MNAINFSEPVVAALIGATATIVTAVVQLRLAAKRQAAERMAGRPATKSNRWLAILALMLASAVGGYALSEFRGYTAREDDRMLRDEMQSRLKDIGAMAVRIERANLQTLPDAEARIAFERKRGLDGIAAVVKVPACRAAPAGCVESDASRTSVCAVVPVAAAVSEVQLFIRADDDAGLWAASKVEAGQDVGGARFVDGYFERAGDSEGKEICMNLAHWGADKARSARILVRYAI